MDLEVAPLETSALSRGGFRFTSKGLIAEGEPTFEDWKHTGRFLREAHKGIHWCIGDWLNYGEAKWGEMYEQAIEETGFDYQTLANDKWVASKIDFSLRGENLSFKHHKAVARLDAPSQKHWLEVAEKEGLTSHSLSQRINQAKHAPHVVDPCNTDDLKTFVDKGIQFGTIYADPPWHYENQGTRGATGDHYQTMKIEDIAALPVAQLAAPLSHLHLWATNAMLFDCQQIMKAWGFKYKGVYVWCKPQMGLGNYWRVSHEFLLLGVRGNCAFLDKGQMSWGNFKRGKHSEKPGQIRAIIERVSPSPRLELFGRLPVAGWSVWGNEIAKDLLSASA
jgi:N6-adenosine-specific RNA methylase IME4